MSSKQTSSAEVPPVCQSASKPCEAHQPNRTIRVLLADDHELVREGLLMLLQTHSDIVVVGLAADGQEAVELALKLRPDVVVLDISMPRLSGIEAARQIVAALPETRVIGLTMFEDQERHEALRAAGAVQCLTKGRSSSHLVTAIRHHAAG